MQRSGHIVELVDRGLYREAISLHSLLHSAALPANRFTFPPLFKACVYLDSPLQGQILHAQLHKSGFHLYTHSATSLTNMYTKLHLPHDAVKVFAEMPRPRRNLASLNAAISGFASTGLCEEAFSLFREVGFAGFRPNSITVASVLSACYCAELCRQVHSWAVKLGVGSDVYVGTAMVTVFLGCGEIFVASRLFGEMPNKNMVSFNAFVSGLLDSGMPDMVLNVFKDMRRSSSKRPTSVVLISVLSACSSLLYLQFGKQVHGFMVKTMASLDIKVGTTLVDMYCKCRSWRWAYDVFSELGNNNKNLVTWNSMISGLMLNGQSDTAAKLFGLLESEGLEPDSVTWNSMISGFAQLDKAGEAVHFFRKMQSSGTIPTLKSVTSLLRACASLSSMRHGKEIHGHAIRTYIHTDEFMATALVDLYMKCGSVSWARKIFDGFDLKPSDPTFWSVMISGYGANGESESGFMIFQQMMEKVKPNLGTFTAMLSLCSHTGEVDKGWQVFKSMTNEYGLIPKPEHFGCMIDLLGRNGRLDEARKLMEIIPEQSSSAFASLLGACRHHLQPDLGEQVAMKLTELDPSNPTPFVMLSNIYAGVGRWTDAERIRMMINDRRLKKLPGYSLV